MKKYKIVLPLVLLFISCGTKKNTTSSNFNTQKLAFSLDSVMNIALEEQPERVGLSMTILGEKIDFKGAVGYDSREKDNVLNVEQPFRIASITKTYVAASILRLQEDGKLNITEPVSKYISDEHIAVLESDGYSPDKISIASCLSHTSGIYDYALAGDAYIYAVIGTPQKRWTRTEQIKFAMDNGDPVGNEGESFMYSDTGYVLLAEIIEKLSGKNYGLAIRDLLGYESLRLDDTYVEILEAAPKENSNYVHRYLATYDATTWDPSMDLYGGGGIVSNTEEIATFVQALFNHKVLKKKESLSVMTKEVNIKNERPNEVHAQGYKFGLYDMEIKNQKAYSHSGFWGIYYYYFPKYNCTVAINQTSVGEDNLIEKVVSILDKNLD